MEQQSSGGNWGSYAGMASKAFSTVLGAVNKNDEGKAAELQAKYVARQLEQNAKGAEATASFEAAEEDRKRNLIASRALAVAAASGAGTLDPTVIKILQGIEAEGELAIQTRLFNGAEEARGMRDQARGVRYEGKQARRAGRLRAISTLTSGIAEQYPTWGRPDERPESSVFSSNDGVYDDGISNANVA